MTIDCRCDKCGAVIKYGHPEVEFSEKSMKPFHRDRKDFCSKCYHELMGVVARWLLRKDTPPCEPDTRGRWFGRK